MSEIFKALQRGAAGEDGAQTDKPLSTFEVLRKAEHLAQEKWEHNSDSSLGVAEAIGFETILRGGALREENPLPAVETQPLNLSSVSVEQPVSANRFQSLSVSINPESHLVSIVDSDSPAAEAFRLLSVRLRDLRETRALKRLLITSTVPREGKSTVAANLACTLARSSRSRTLLIEGDLRRPTQSGIFGFDKSVPGLTQYLKGSCELSKSIYQLGSLGLCILPAGTNGTKNPLGLLQPQRIASLMKQLNESFDLIIVDSPPVLPLADTSIWMKLVDAILLVTRHGVTERKPLQRGLEMIEPDKLLGTVMNSSNSLPHTAYYY